MANTNDGSKNTINPNMIILDHETVIKFLNETSNTNNITREHIIRFILHCCPQMLNYLMKFIMQNKFENKSDKKNISLNELKRKREYISDYNDILKRPKLSNNCINFRTCNDPFCKKTHIYSRKRNFCSIYKEKRMCPLKPCPLYHE